MDHRPKHKTYNSTVLEDTEKGLGVLVIGSGLRRNTRARHTSRTPSTLRTPAPGRLSGAWTDKAGLGKTFANYMSDKGVIVRQKI